MKNNSRVYYTGTILFYLFLVLILGNLFYNCSSEDGEPVPTIQESLGNGGKEKYTYVYQLNMDNYNMPIEGSIPEYDDSPEGKILVIWLMGIGQVLSILLINLSL